MLQTKPLANPIITGISISDSKVSVTSENFPFDKNIS